MDDIEERMADIDERMWDYRILKEQQRETRRMVWFCVLILGPIGISVTALLVALAK